MQELGTEYVNIVTSLSTYLKIVIIMLHLHPISCDCLHFVLNIVQCNAKWSWVTIKFGRSYVLFMILNQVDWTYYLRVYHLDNFVPYRSPNCASDCITMNRDELCKQTTYVHWLKFGWRLPSNVLLMLNMSARMGNANHWLIYCTTYVCIQ